MSSSPRAHNTTSSSPQRIRTTSLTHCPGHSRAISSSFHRNVRTGTHPQHCHRPTVAQSQHCRRPTDAQAQHCRCPAGTHTTFVVAATDTRTISSSLPRSHKQHRRRCHRHAHNIVVAVTGTRTTSSSLPRTRAQHRRCIVYLYAQLRCTAACSRQASALALPHYHGHAHHIAADTTGAHTTLSPSQGTHTILLSPRPRMQQTRRRRGHTNNTRRRGPTPKHRCIMVMHTRA